MRTLLFCLAILGSLSVSAQQLTLKKGQKFSGEYLNVTTGILSTLDTDLIYDAYDFEVVKVRDTTYELKTQLSRHISYNSYDSRFLDTSLPPQGRERNIDQLTDRMLTKVPFLLSISNKGKLISVSGFDAIASKLLERVKLQPLPEKIYKTKDEDFIKIRLSADHYRYIASAFFNQQAKQRTDTTFTRFEGEKLADTMTVKKETIKDPKTGLTLLYYRDSLSRGTQPGKNIFHNDTYATWYSIKSSSTRNAPAQRDLLTRLSEIIDPVKESSAQKRLATEVRDLDEWYENSKGKLDIDAVVIRKLDSLEKYVKPEDYDFWASEVELLSYFDYDRKLKLIDRLPVESLLSDASVAEKAKFAYHKRDQAAFVNALKIMFSKFARNGDYPLNAAHIAQLVHYHICKEVFKSNDRNELISIQQVVSSVRKLNNTHLNEIFDGITAYLSAKLAGNFQELEPILKERFNSSFDNYGRYRLLIYDRMTSLKAPDSVRAAYLDYSIEMFRTSIQEILTPMEREGSEKFFFDSHIKPNRITLRKHLADAYYRKSLLNKASALNYLQLATDYLPSQEDQIEGKELVEREYLYAPELNYTELYLQAAGSKGMSEEEMLKKYVDLVILEPDRYAVLKQKYEKLYPQGNLRSFFSKVLREKLPATPEYHLTDRKSIAVSSEVKDGKYVFIDFWGTWCGACVAEIDKIEELHLNNPNPDKLKVTTIACYDKENLVDEFMEKKKFSYQVLMSDNIVEKNFKVRSYPTKLLLLPNQVYLVIPFSNDYKSLVSKYLSWDL